MLSAIKHASLFHQFVNYIEKKFFGMSGRAHLLSFY
jgi:hypothetical protein